MNDLIQELSLEQWVATSPDEQRGFREAVHIILTAIGTSSDLSSRMVMKGGLLMAIRYDSTRFTRDIDFSTLEKHRQADEDSLLQELDAQLVWANDHLAYDTMCLRQNAKLNPKSPNPSFPTLQISIGYAPRSNASHLRRLQAKQSSTKVQIDYSFDEAVLDVEILALEDGEQLKAYSLTNLLAEKYRSLLQQPVRNRTRRQDVFDIHMLLTRCAKLSAHEKTRLLRQLIDSCKAREIAAMQTSMANSLVREMAMADYHSLANEIDDELPDFDSAYATIQAFYEGLPWGTGIVSETK
ncbi:nucleotidyl transferase AbiEii/AbiGii toxin family protein [Dechloromonas hortensis]|uniref:nucleotidyl transferase AbiEii/AbiGii toxin family protein n=1 Tax=Dechloromonas hortensis TaxID=337779 RepID=UPI001290F683|nr:nucleotidyl transferase AbiEii/AbiGii toxin family protein [Dechloromonas hortensis]